MQPIEESNRINQSIAGQQRSKQPEPSPEMKTKKNRPQAQKIYSSPIPHRTSHLLRQPTNHLQPDPIVLFPRPPILPCFSSSPTFRYSPFANCFEPLCFLICSCLCSLMPVSATRWHARHVTFGSGTRPCLVLSVTIIHQQTEAPPFFLSVFSFFSLFFPVASLSLSILLVPLPLLLHSYKHLYYSVSTPQCNASIVKRHPISLV
ncbi:hypothetical protein J3F84DRAFT_58371 [Trichoderma pleuroticola]